MVLPVRDHRRKRRAGQAGAHREHGIARLQIVGGHGGGRQRADSRRQRMRLGDSALALQRRHHRRTEQLGDLGELVARLGVEHALAGPDHGRLGREQALGSLPHRPLVGRRAHAPDRRVGGSPVHLGRAHVARQLQHHRLRPARAERRERLAQLDRHEVGGQHLLRHLRGRGVVGGAVEGGRLIDIGGTGMAGEEEQRRRIRVRLGDAGKGVLRPRQRLHREDADLAAVGGARDAVRHVAGDAFLARGDDAHPGPRHRLDDRGHGETETLADAFRLQNFHQKIGAGHAALPNVPRRLPSAGEAALLRLLSTQRAARASSAFKSGAVLPAGSRG